MEVRTVRDDVTRRAALADVSALIVLDSAPDLPREGERLEVIGTMVQASEARHWPISPPGPVDASPFWMDQAASASPPWSCASSCHRVFEVPGGKWLLTTPSIRHLLTLGAPATSPIGQPAPVEA